MMMNPVERMMKRMLTALRKTSKELSAAEETVDTLRNTKWRLVKELKALEFDFTATPEGVDVILSAPPSMKF
jgi:hypothetical protein|tara:strand:- start:640 stop:855 length:216 start_codon:yes stop_codon:yes gene_type:complete